jgi:hypothetical protein
MGKRIEGKKISAVMLDWKKGSDYRDKFSEVMTVIESERSILLDFGVLEEEGKKGLEEGIQSVNPYIEHHTRIRVSPEHFKAIVDVLKGQIEELEETEGETE